MRINDYEQFKTIDDLAAHYLNKYPELYKTKTEAKKAALKDLPKESAFQSKIMEYLKTRSDVVAWKDQASMYQSKGIPDIIAVKDGRFYGFEVKRPYVGKLSDIQSSFHAKLKHVKGRVFVVSYVSEVAGAIDAD